MVDPNKPHMVKLHRTMRETVTAKQAVTNSIHALGKLYLAQLEAKRKDMAQRDMLSAPLGKNGT